MYVILSIVPFSRNALYVAAKIIDYSMMNFDAQVKADAARPSNVGIGKQAFEDLTDLQNDEFIVSFLVSSSFYNFY